MGGCTQSDEAYQIDNVEILIYYLSLCRADVDIKLAEMIATYMKFAYFASQWQYKNVHFYCDHDTVVFSIADKRASINHRLYKVGQIDPKDFEYIDNGEIVSIVNDAKYSDYFNSSYTP